MPFDKAEPAPVGRWSLRRLRSIRSKLTLGFGALIGLVMLNTGLYFWGAARRSQAFEALQGSIERQALLTEANNRVEDQQTYFDLLAVYSGDSDTGVTSESEAEVQSRLGEAAQFADQIDKTTEMVRRAAERAEPDRQADADSVAERTARVGDAWKRYFDLEARDDERAVEVLYVEAEPIARQLLDVDFPAAMRAEEDRLRNLSDEFVRTSRVFGSLTVAVLLASVVVGGLLAFAISRDLLGAVGALRRGAEALGAGRRDHRISLGRTDELGDVAAAFDAMADRLDERTAEVEEQRDNLTATLQELRATQAQLVQREKLASLGELTAGIAHEIKNPLNFVNNFAALSAELVGEVREVLDGASGQLSEPARAELDALLDDLGTNARKIEVHGRRADAIVRSMLEHSRQRSGEQTEIDVNDLAREYATLAYHGQRAQDPDFVADLAYDLASDAGTAVLSPTEIGRVVVNLVSNALDAVRDEAAAAPPGYTPTVRVSTRREPDAVVIRVEDNGSGLAPEVAAKVFEPFFTTKPTGKGTGLGLSLSHEIVTQGHGGTLRTLPADRGAAFEMSLPVS